jgi:TRAP-type uncharacterized transport system substrate-binding protein
MHPALRRSLYWLLLVVAIGVAANSIWLALPPRLVVIETGPVGGSYYENAVRYARRLEAAGFKAEIRPNPQSLTTIDHINAGNPRVDVGFTVQALDRSNYPNVASVGLVEMQPLFIFYNLKLGTMQGPASLRAKRLVMPPENSATSEAARAVLGLYGITPQNTRFTYLPIAQAAEELKSGLHDAGLFMLAPANPIIRGLVDTDALTMLSIPEAVGLSRILDHLKPAVLPLGAFDLQKKLPNGDLSVVCGTVNVMVRKDINPAVLYALLEAMKDTHQGQTLVSSKGDFPSALGTALDIHPLAAQWAKSGTPWIFNRFTPILASLIDKYWLLVVVLIVLAEIYRVTHYVYEFVQLGASSTALRILLKLRKRVAAGRAIGPIGKKMYALAEAILLKESQNARARLLLEQLRPAVTKD